VTPLTSGLRPLPLRSSPSPHSRSQPQPQSCPSPCPALHQPSHSHTHLTPLTPTIPTALHQTTSSPIGELRLDRSQSENVDDIRVGLRPRECDWDCCESYFEPRLLGADVGEAARSFELVRVGMGTGTATVADVNIEIKASSTRQPQPRLASLDRIC
jgi:hypothetical protein